MKESSKYPGYFHVPGYGLYALNEQGDLIQVVTGHRIGYRRNTSGYYVASLINDAGFRRQVARCRLMCMTFKPNDMSSFLQVDHINCDKGDDRLCNLDWVTPKENCRRAAKNGLYKGAHPVIVRDIDTKKETVYPSMAEAARAHGMSKDAMQYRLELNDGRVWPERKQYSFLDKLVNWADTEDAEYQIEEFGHNRRIVLRNLSSGQIREFDRMGDASEFLGISQSLLSTCMSTKKHPVLKGLWQAKMKSDSSEWRTPSDPIGELADQSKTSVVVAVNSTKKIKQIYLVQKECAINHNLLVNTLNYRLKYGDPCKVYPDGWCYRYYDAKEDSSTTSDFHVEYYL